jgi:TatA/E family protein of Tat protein translocase
MKTQARLSSNFFVRPSVHKRAHQASKHWQLRTAMKNDDTSFDCNRFRTLKTITIPGHRKLYCDDHRKRGDKQKANSFFGVGAPEALVIGVVALVVFGPKGLADLAKQLGQTLRQFKPTIQELQEVSREFQETLSQEIGVDDITRPLAQPQKRMKPVRDAKVEDDDMRTRESAKVKFETSTTSSAQREMIEQSKRAAWGGNVPGNLSTSDDVTAFVGDAVVVADDVQEEAVMREYDYTDTTKTTSN